MNESAIIFAFVVLLLLAAGEIPGTIHDSQPIQQVAALDREQPIQFIAMGTSLAAAPGQ